MWVLISTGLKFRVGNGKTLKNEFIYFVHVTSEEVIDQNKKPNICNLFPLHRNP